ncbi:hypothetical protein ACP70R_036684 [Stipagrostis hirtigluma subsp. patula]
MAEEAKHLETARADRSVWLMKCPAVVSRAWQEAASSSAPEAGGGANPSPVVAKVVLSLDLLADDQPTQIKMEMAQADNGNTPKSYSLNLYNDFVPMCILSESNQGKIACEGKVENKFDMKPHRENLVDYGKLCRERTNQSMIKHRTLEVIKDKGMLITPLPRMDPPRKKKKPPPTKPYDTKRTRMGRRELENILFKLFERQPNWSLKQLVQKTDQPEQFLKDVVNGLCVYNKRGPNQGTHELKPEYKKCTEENGAP